ncbi:MAG: site-2 protease family protein [Planctomycetota bacterium]
MPGERTRPDPTARLQGRLTLNPVAHLDPIGTLAILFLPLGWAKPVPINPQNFRNPRKDAILTSFYGPLANMLQGIFWCLVLRMLKQYAPSVIVSDGSVTIVGGFLGFMAFLNFILALFNLIPLGVLDGHHIVENALPYPESEAYSRFNRQYGMAILLGVIGVQFILGIPIISIILITPARFVSSFIAGLDPLIYASNSGILR